MSFPTMTVNAVSTCLRAFQVFVVTVRRRILNTREGELMKKPLHPRPDPNSKPRRLRFLTGAILAAGSVVFQGPVSAVQFEAGEFAGSFDNTISYGATWRVQDRDRDLLGVASTTLPNGAVPPGGLGGRAFSVNGDDGNLNYDKGLVSNVIKLTSELSLEHSSGYGAFVRGSAFYDFENEDGDREKIELSNKALDQVGSDINLLDAYVYGGFDVGEVPVDLRLGNQVVSWGESTFIQNGINVINPVDVAAIRVPGAELREALLPVNMLWGNAGVTLNSSVEGFYQFEWEETKPDPSGSYFSTNDFATPGGEKLMLGFGQVPDIIPFGPAGAASIGASPTGVAVPRSADRKADDSGQYGLAYRVYAPEVGDTEFGFYYMNYHSRLPIISARTGTLAGVASGTTRARPVITRSIPRTFSCSAPVSTPQWAPPAGRCRGSWPTRRMCPCRWMTSSCCSRRCHRWRYPRRQPARPG
jgi:hypothetical protein